MAAFILDKSIATRGDGYLSSSHSINAGVPQRSVISHVLFILFIDDLLTPAATSILSFADDNHLSSSFSFDSPHNSAMNNPIRIFHISASLLTDDLAKSRNGCKESLIIVMM